MRRILTVRELEVSYGSVPAVKGIDLSVVEGSITVLLGANGAGKTSIISGILGVTRLQSGHIYVPEGEEVARVLPDEMNRRGVAWVPEGRQVFANLTVHENLMMGAFRVRDRDERDRRLDWVIQQFPALAERLQQLAGSLSGGEQQMLAVGRALMSRPALLIMDEPSLGLAPRVVRSLFDFVHGMKGEAISILMAEQNAKQALRISDYVYLLSHGEIVAEGEPNEMAERDDVRRTFLGGA